MSSLERVGRPVLFYVTFTSLGFLLHQMFDGPV